MAQPTFTWQFVSAGTDAVPTWSTIGGAETITPTGAGSSDGDLKAIQAPSASGVRLADECWIDQATDTQLSLYQNGGGADISGYASDIFPTDLTNTNNFAILCATNSEAQAGELECWDDGSFNSTTNEMLAGTTNLSGHSQVRACETASNVASNAGAGSIPGPYNTQTAQTTTYQLQGDTRSLIFSTPLVTDNQNRFLLHLFVVDDSTAGLETSETTYKYYYT